MWGILGDRRGRLSVLFGSILLYSLANLANGWVQTVEQYATLRLIAGIGLAGELGAGITLVAESLPREKRGYGTTLVAVVGLMGAVLAYFVAEWLSWRNAYIAGGVLGLSLLALRVGVLESGLYQSQATDKHLRGNLKLLITPPSRFWRYLQCILIGIPIWYGVGILITFSPELAQALGVSGEISSGRAVMLSYIGLAVGDMCSGLLSQWLKRRKQVVALFITLTALVSVWYLLYPPADAEGFYLICFALGVAVGYWALFVTVAAEQFGTNIRATVTTSVPNFVRGTVVPITLLFQWLQQSWGLVNSALIVGALCCLVAGAALWGMRESFSRSLDFTEE